MAQENTGHPNNEKQLSPFRGILLLAGVFLLLYEPWNLGLKDFWRLEGFYTALAQEMDAGWLLCSAHGTAFQNVLPLYPRLGSLLAEKTGWEMLTALRIVSVSMTFLTGLLIAFSVWRARNFTAAAAAVAIFWGSNIVLEKSWDAYPTSTAVMGLLAAQLTWFYIGAKRGSWNWAWISSLIILALTFLAGGFQVLALFILPMVFLHRPLTLWPKLAKPGTLIGVGILTAAVLLWLMPYRMPGQVMPIQYWEPDWDWMPYLNSLLQYPLDFAIRFFPWILILWAPFCAALQPLDPTPVFSRYLRTLTIATFFLLWLSPERESHDLMFLAAPLAMLGGMYYETLVTRFAPPLRWIAVRAGSLFILILALVMLLFCILPESLIKLYLELHQPINYREDLPYRIICFSTILLLFAAAAYLRMGSVRKPLWITMLTPVLACGLFYHIVMFPYRIQEQDSRGMAQLLAKVLAKDRNHAEKPASVYKFNISDLYGECSALHARIRKIGSLDELPIGEKTVYLLSTDFPQQPDWDWSNLLPQDQTYRRRRICFWKGILHKDDAEKEPLP